MRRALAACRWPNGSGRLFVSFAAASLPAASGKKLEAIRAAARLEYPTADIDRMLAEIERGYGMGTNP